MCDGDLDTILSYLSSKINKIVCDREFVGCVKEDFDLILANSDNNCVLFPKLKPIFLKLLRYQALIFDLNVFQIGSGDNQVAVVCKRTTLKEQPQCAPKLAKTMDEKSLAKVKKSRANRPTQSYYVPPAQRSKKKTESGSRQKKDKSDPVVRSWVEASLQGDVVSEDENRTTEDNWQEETSLANLNECALACSSNVDEQEQLKNPPTSPDKSSLSLGKFTEESPVSEDLETKTETMNEAKDLLEQDLDINSKTIKDASLASNKLEEHIETIDELKECGSTQTLNEAKALLASNSLDDVDTTTESINESELLLTSLNLHSTEANSLLTSPPFVKNHLKQSNNIKPNFVNEEDSSCIKNKLNKSEVTSLTSDLFISPTSTNANKKSVNDDAEIEKEMQKAIQSINRKRRTIMQQIRGDNVQQDILQLPKPCIDDELNEEGDSLANWEDMFDDNGDLQSKYFEEIVKHIGCDVKVVKASHDYSAYQSTKYQDLEHVIELYDFPSTFRTQDLMQLYSSASKDPMYVKWCDNTHALLVLSTPSRAQRALKIEHDIIKSRPLSEGSSVAISIACSTDLKPAMTRPATNMQTARRLINTHLGTKAGLSKELQEQERQALRLAREQRRQERQNEKDAWEGRLRSAKSQCSS